MNDIHAIAFATGYLEQRDFRLGGIFFLILGPLTAFLIATLWALLKV
ncbi:MAG: hypothetical protein ACK4XY_03275 [Chloroherpetonaceae bacterium]